MYFHLPFRQTKKECIAQEDMSWKSTFHPRLHHNKHRRINKLNIKVEDIVTKESTRDEYIVITVDITGIKVTNRGQWMGEDKWHLKNKQGYLKIHIIAVNIKINKNILSIKVTDEDEHVHDDSKVLPKLVNDIIKLDKK